MSYKMDYGDRRMVLHDGCKNPTAYYFHENGAKVWIEVDPKDVGECDEECILFRIGEMFGCGPEQEGGYCTRPFKPLDYQTAEELGMI